MKVALASDHAEFELKSESADFKNRNRRNRHVLTER
jgi:ribose 5-phosphate isomerase RpiB